MIQNTFYRFKKKKKLIWKKFKIHQAQLFKKVW